MRKVIAILLVLVLSLAIVTVYSEEGRTRGGLTYTINDGQITITGYQGVNTELTIPSEIDGYPVIAIGDEAFYGDKFIERITISEGIIDIGERAFYACSSLESIILPESLIRIGDRAFAVHNDIERMYIPSGVKEITTNPFYYCSQLTEINISEENEIFIFEDRLIIDTRSETVIAYIPARRNEKVNTITIPDSIKRIESYAFGGYFTVRGLIVPPSVIEIGQNAFDDDTSLIVDDGSYAEKWAQENNARYVYADAD